MFVLQSLEYFRRIPTKLCDWSIDKLISQKIVNAYPVQNFHVLRAY